jgi:RNA polymerase sigma factor (sigma-70 family)
MTDAASGRRAFPTDHPLLHDRARLDAITDLMWARIQKTVAPHGPRVRRRSNADLVVVGGIVVQDVLAEALAALLYTEPRTLRTSWEALATTIAHNKAVQAVRDKTKGRRSGAQEIQLTSLDALDDNGRNLAEGLAEELADPEAEAIALQQELILKRLALQHLSERDREIYFRIHYLGQARNMIGPDYGISPQAVGQIYAKAARRLNEEAQRDPEFMRISDYEGGN